MQSLSTYLPRGTTYFYGYPAGEDSNFYNLVPPEIEELVSARPLVCAGDDTRIIAFQAASNKRIRTLLESLGMSVIPEQQIIPLPPDIDTTVRGAERNKRVISALKKLVPEKSLIMAQPYMRDSLKDKYLLDPVVCNALNDKANMNEYIPKEYLPNMLACYSCGKEFAQDDRDVSPCVVKVSSSSSGDGVRICRDAASLQRVREEFTLVQEKILLQEFIDAAENIGVQFAIPADASQPVDILGMSQQITSDGGEFNGGVVMRDTPFPERVRTVLLADILPKIRARGWYGIGGLDVLMTKEGSIRFIDPNFRITAMTAFVCQSVNDVMQRNMISMTGILRGNERQLRDIATADDQDQLLTLAALRECEQGFQFNGALLFDQRETLRENACRAKAAGISSAVLDALTGSRASQLLPSSIQ